MLVYTFLNLPRSVFIARSFFASLPAEPAESGFVDGAGHLEIFSRLMLPPAQPAVSAIVILTRARSVLHSRHDRGRAQELIPPAAACAGCPCRHRDSSEPCGPLLRHAESRPTSGRARGWPSCNRESPRVWPFCRRTTPAAAGRAGPSSGIRATRTEDGAASAAKAARIPKPAASPRPVALRDRRSGSGAAHPACGVRPPEGLEKTALDFSPAMHYSAQQNGRGHTCFTRFPL